MPFWNVKCKESEFCEMQNVKNAHFYKLFNNKVDYLVAFVHFHICIMHFKDFDEFLVFDNSVSSIPYSTLWNTIDPF